MSFDELRFPSLRAVLEEASLLRHDGPWSAADLEALLQKLSSINIVHPRQLWNALNDSSSSGSSCHLRDASTGLNARLRAAGKRPLFIRTLQILRLLLTKCQHVFLYGALREGLAHHDIIQEEGLERAGGLFRTVETAYEMVWRSASQAVSSDAAVDVDPIAYILPGVRCHNAGDIGYSASAGNNAVVSTASGVCYGSCTASCGVTGELYRVDRDDQLRYLDEVKTPTYRRVRVFVYKCTDISGQQERGEGGPGCECSAATSTSVNSDSNKAKEGTVTPKAHFDHRTAIGDDSHSHWTVAYMYVASESVRMEISEWSLLRNSDCSCSKNDGSNGTTKVKRNSFSQVLGGNWCARVERCVEGNACILFTAPHTLLLHREGQENHVQEDYTGYLCRYFARCTNSTCITWTERERKRVKKLKRGSSGTGRSDDAVPDPANRDPNYLRKDELPYSIWFSLLDESLRCMRRHSRSEAVILSPVEAPTRLTTKVVSAYSIGHKDSHQALPFNWVAVTHFDIHGMTDKHGSDCVVGTGAIEQLIDAAAIRRLHQHIRSQLDHVLVAAGLRAVDFNRTSSGVVLSGRIPMAERSTLTQMSCNGALFATHGLASVDTHSYPCSCSLQMELSLKLRRLLHDKPNFRASFAEALEAVHRSLND